MTEILMPVPKQVIRTRVCSSCRYGQQIRTETVECRRFPPTAFLIGTPKGPVPGAAYPPMRVDQWCGEWANKIEGVTP